MDLEQDFCLHGIFQEYSVFCYCRRASGCSGNRKIQKLPEGKRMQNLLFQFRDMMESYPPPIQQAKIHRALSGRVCGSDFHIWRKSRYCTWAEAHRQRFVQWTEYWRYAVNFALRSHLDDIESFATIFGDKPVRKSEKVVGETRQIINEKLRQKWKYEPFSLQNKTTWTLYDSDAGCSDADAWWNGDMSIVQNTPVNVVIKLTALALFGGAYYMGKIVDIRI